MGSSRASILNLKGGARMREGSIAGDPLDALIIRARQGSFEIVKAH